MIQTCDYCKEQFDGPPQRKYCPKPKTCTSKARYARSRMNPERRAEIREANRLQKQKERGGIAFVPFMRKCVVCGEPFKIENKFQQKLEVCGHNCFKIRANAARHSFEARERRAEYKRIYTKRTREIACNVEKPAQVSAPVSEYASRNSKPGAGIAQVKPSKKRTDALSAACDRIVCEAWARGDEYERATIERNNQQIMFVEVMG